MTEDQITFYDQFMQTSREFRRVHILFLATVDLSALCLTLSIFTLFQDDWIELADKLASDYPELDFNAPTIPAWSISDVTFDVISFTTSMPPNVDELSF